MTSVSSSAGTSCRDVPHGRDRCLDVVRAQRGAVTVAVVGRVAGQQLEQQAAQRVDVGRPGDHAPEVLLGRHVRGRADGAVDLGEPRQRTGAAQDRDAEVEHLHQPAVDDHDVGGLDVAVHHVDPVDVGEHRRDLRPDRRRPRDRRGGVAVEDGLVHAVFQGRAAQQVV